MADISNSDDVIDSRDITDRIEELESERGDLESAVEAAQEALDEAEEAAKGDETGETTADVNSASMALEDASQALREFDDSPAGEELATLRKLAEDGANYADDWEYGVTLIRDSYFQEYAEELADDIGAIDKKAGWPLNCIDWEAAADQLKMDYTAIEFDGVTYWVR